MNPTAPDGIINQKGNSTYICVSANGDDQSIPCPKMNCSGGGPNRSIMSVKTSSMNLPIRYSPNQRNLANGSATPGGGFRPATARSPGDQWTAPAPEIAGPPRAHHATRSPRGGPRTRRPLPLPLIMTLVPPAWFVFKRQTSSVRRAAAFRLATIDIRYHTLRIGYIALFGV